MIEVNSIWFMGLWELVLLLLAVDVVIVVRAVTRRRRERASIERLVTLVRQNMAQREQETRNLLEKRYGYSGEALEKTTKKILREERRIYQTLANLFTTRDHMAIENLSIAFEEAVEPYRTLELPQAAAADEAAEPGEDHEAELKRLKAQNQTLSDELKVTMNTISRMLHEYSNIFSEAGADKKDQAAVAELIARHPMPEEPSPEEVAEADPPPEETADETVAAADEEDLDSAALVGMFQEEEDEPLAAEQDAADEVAADEAEAAEPRAAPPETEGSGAAPAAQELDQEIDEVLSGFDTDLSDLEEDAPDAPQDPDEAHDADAPEKDPDGAVEDPLEELLTQAIDETFKQHETPLPDSLDESPPDAPDEAEPPPAGETPGTAGPPTENLTDEDIDSLLQGAIADMPEK